MAAKKAVKRTSYASMSVRALVDELGARKAVLADAKADVDAIANELKAKCASAKIMLARKVSESFEGRLFEVVVYAQNKVAVDWQAVCADAKVPARIVEKHTTRTPTHAYKVQARVMPT